MKSLAEICLAVDCLKKKNRETQKIGSKQKFFGIFFLSLFFLFPTPAIAQSILGINYLDPNTLAGAIPQNIANETIKMLGIYIVHRPYSGATSVSESNGLDFGIEATLVKIGDGLVNDLKADGLISSSTSNTPPAVPMAKIHFRKGFGEWFDIGLSGLYYRGQEILGGDLKFVLHHPEEGLTWALRLGYTHASVPYAYIKSCDIFSPELVVSRPLYFSEPYLGIGGRYITGTISVPFNTGAINVPSVPNSFNVSKSGSGSTGYAFTGVYFRIFGAQGLRLGIDGTFDLSGYHTVGAIVGLGF